VAHWVFYRTLQSIWAKAKQWADWVLDVGGCHAWLALLFPTTWQQHCDQDANRGKGRICMGVTELAHNEARHEGKQRKPEQTRPLQGADGSWRRRVCRNNPRHGRDKVPHGNNATPRQNGKEQVRGAPGAWLIV